MCLKNQARPQFLWSEPQQRKCTTFSEDNGMYYADQTECTYEGYLTSYEAFFPPLQSGKGGLLRHREYEASDTTSHHQVLAFGRSIWRALITLMYGRPLVIRVSGRVWRRELEFIATLFVHCDYLSVSNDVLQSLGNTLRGIPELWAKIVTEPELFFHLAYRLWQPEIYLDAAKHLIGMQILNDQAGRVDPSAFSQGGSIVEAKFYENEMMTILLAGANELQSKIAKLHVKLLRHAHGTRHLPIRRFLLPAGQNGYTLQQKAEKAKEPYVAAATQLLDNYVVNALGSCTISWSRLPGMQFEAGAEHPLFLLQRICTGLDEHLIELVLKVSYIAATKKLDQDKLMRCLKIILEHFGKSFLGVELLQQHHSSTCLTRPQYTTGDWAVGSNRECSRCFRSRHEVRTYFTWLDRNGLLGSRGDRPWPLGRDPQEDLVKGFETRTTSASYEYIRQLGLRNEFSFLSTQFEHRIDR